MLNIIPFINNNKVNFDNRIQQNINFTARLPIVSVNSNKLSELSADTVELSKACINDLNNIDFDKLRKLNIINLRRINENCFSGGTFENRPVEDLMALRECGIDKIIDFRVDAECLFANVCKNNDFEYFNFPLDDVRRLTNPLYFIRKKDDKTVVTQDFVNSLKKYFQMMNKGKAYAGCYYGIDRTNMGLTLNYLLNENTMQIPPQIITWPGERKKTIINQNIKAVKKIYKNLSDKQKEDLNLSKDYNSCLKEKIYKLIEANKVWAE